jgi:hypothetical protein
MSEDETQPAPIEDSPPPAAGAPESGPSKPPAADLSEPPTVDPFATSPELAAAEPGTEPVQVPPPPGPLPGAWATLGGGLDLSLSANRELRRASLYIGLLTLGLVGPFVIVILAFGAVQGGFDWVMDAMLGLQPDLVPVDPGVEGSLIISGIVALVGLFVVGIESQIMAAAILGGRALDRPMTMREALRRSRQVFWRVVRASMLVGLILVIPYVILSLTLRSMFGITSEAPSVILTGLGAMMAAPFAYIVTGIVLGDVGARESVRRSALLARARWRLAIAVSAVGAVAGYIELFATGAGMDILARVGGVLHLGFDSSVGTAVLVFVTLAGVLAVGSLTFTMAALRDAPQVVAFVGMTGYGAGLDRSREPSDGARRLERWISIPMAIGIAVGIWAGVTGVVALS